MKNLFLIRGLPGSGKSTFASAIAKAVFSADDFFVTEAGEYKFDSALIKQAHTACQRRTKLAMQRGEQPIVVANTFTQEWELAPYLSLAKEFGYRVHSLVVENRHGGKNVHSVPDEVITKMRDRFEIQL